jgi:feruloyl esterase
MLGQAQRFPTLYNGILAAAPAINWVTFLITEYYAHVAMKTLDYHPPGCELEAIRQAAIEACDELDGVKDGIIAAYGQCTFDPSSIVGQSYDCEGSSKKITKEAAEIAKITWSGPNDEQGKPIWYGLTQDSPLQGADPLYKGLARTTCDDNNENCKSDPFPISLDWIKNWVLKDSDYDVSTIDEEKFHEILKTSRDQYHSLMDSAIPDLRKYEQNGGKIISWHGFVSSSIPSTQSFSPSADISLYRLADQLIPPNGTTDYYNRVSAHSPNIRSFFRHFETPGVAHCFAGPGPFPLTAFLDLVNWVEKGQAPEHLTAQQLGGMDGSPPEVERTRKLCPWPTVPVWNGSGDVNDAGSWECKENFEGGVEVKGGKDEL